MSTHSQRFAVGDPQGARSSEWVIMWKSNASDVYIATRTVGGAFKASIHEGGRCHVRAPDPKGWRSPGPPPKFMETWSIDPSANYSYPFGIIVSEPELREGEWAKHRDKGTIWLPVPKGEGVEVAIFLIRTESDQTKSLEASGWHTTIVNTQLPDGRRLLVVAGKSMAHLSRQEELKNTRAIAAEMMSTSDKPFVNPRLLLVAVDDKGTRRFVEVAGRPAA